MMGVGILWIEVHYTAVPYKSLELNDFVVTINVIQHEFGSVHIELDIMLEVYIRRISQHIYLQQNAQTFAIT